MSQNASLEWQAKILKHVEDLVFLGYYPVACIYGSKIPAGNGWEKISSPEKLVLRFASQRVDKDCYIKAKDGKLHYLEPKRANLGILLGEETFGTDGTSHILGALDLDQDNPQHEEFLRGLLRNGVQVRRKGTKGFAQFFRHSIPGMDNVTLGKSNKAMIEILGRGRQVIIPPSELLVLSPEAKDRIKQEQVDGKFVPLEIVKFYQEYGAEVVGYQWLTERNLFNTKVEDLPELCESRYRELRIYISACDSSTMFRLHTVTYQGEGAGGGFHDAALATVASFVAHDFPDDYIVRRCVELSEDACRRGGQLEEFRRRWDAVREIEGYITEAKANFDSGKWTKNKYTAGARLKDRMEGKAVEAHRVNDLMVRKGLREDVPTVVKVSNQSFDERYFANKFIEDNGGRDLWIQLVDFSEHKLDPDYMYQYVDGFWQKVSINPKTSLVPGHLTRAYGMKRSHALQVLAVLSDFVQQVRRKDFEMSRTRYIKVNNGTFDIQSFTLNEDDPKYSCTAKIDVDYNEELADCPVYEKFLDTLFTQLEVNAYDTRTPEQMEEDKRLSIQAYEEFMGYTLIQDTSFGKALFLKGKSNAGKTEALKLLQLFHTETLSTIALEDLSDMVTREVLTRTLVNAADEINKKEDFDARSFKQIVRGMGIVVKKLFEQPRADARITARLVFCLNDFPDTIEINNSVEGRMLVLSCNNVLPEKMRDSRLGQKLAAEKSAIFVRWIKALKRLLERGCFVEPLSHTHEIAQFQSQNDPLSDFIELEIRFLGHKLTGKTHELVWTSEDEAYARFRLFSERRGVARVPTQKQFSNRVKDFLSQKALSPKRRMEGGRYSVYYPIELFPMRGGSEF